MEEVAIHWVVTMVSVGISVASMVVAFYKTRRTEDRRDYHAHSTERRLDFEAIISALNDRVATLEGLVASKQEERDRMQSEITALREEQTGVEVDLAACRAQHAAALAETDALRKRILALEVKQ